MVLETERTVQSASQVVSIADIVVDKGFMMRDGIDKKTVESYKENLVAIVDASPIVVFETPNGLMLVDGFHRLVAARQLNWEQITVQKYKGSVQDAFAFACLANLKHGRPLTRSEREHAVKEYIVRNAELSIRWIAKDTGVSIGTIDGWRQDLITDGRIKANEPTKGLDGKDYSPVQNRTPEPIHDEFDVWFNRYVHQGDIFELLEKDTLKYDLIIADPPYGITSETWDKQTKFDLLNFTRRWLNLVLQKLKPTGRIFIFWSREHLFELKPLFDEIKAEYPLNFGGLLVWNFRNVMSICNNQKTFKITWEPIFYFYGLDAPDLNSPDTEIEGKKWNFETHSDVWTFAIPQSNFSDKKIHPAQKPLDLYKHIIQVSTKPNDLILDPFAGSGTTGHAAYELGREFRLIEQNPEYVLGIRERLKGVFHDGK